VSKHSKIYSRKLDSLGFRFMPIGRPKSCWTGPPRGDGAKPESYEAVTYGNDIFIRPKYKNDVRVLREEMIHAEQQRAGLRTDEIIRAEIQARLLMIRNRHRWGLINDEVRMMVGEIRILRQSREH
jgi:hypothetical protein